MFRRFIKIIVESRYSLIIGLLAGLAIFLIILFQTEIIFYFYPDVYVLNLNELFKSGVYLTLENGFGLTHGYLIADSNTYFKALLLSSSYGIVKYKRFVRKIRPMKTEGIVRSPLNAKVWKGKKPPFLVLVNSLHRHNWVMNYWLLFNLLRNSSFFQGVKLLFWEFYEKYNYNIRKRKFLRYIYVLRNVIHTFPGLFVNKKSKRFRRMYFPWQLREYNRYNVVKNYSYYNVYKKFSYYIYNNFFVDRIEPYRFHNYLKRRKGYPWVKFGSYVYYKWPGYKENTARNNSYEHVYKYRYYNFFTAPRRWWPRRVVLTYLRTYDPKGFHYNRWFFPWGENNERPDRRKRDFESHFSSFYTEKFLFNTSTASRRKIRVFLRDLLNWNVFYRNRYNYVDSFKFLDNVWTRDWTMRRRKSRLRWKKDYKKRRARDYAFGNRARYFYWRRVFSRYGYDKRDYVFKNYNVLGNFKKYYMPTRPDFYLIPSLYKMYNLIFFFYRVYLNFINFGITVVRRNTKYDAFFKSSDIANIYKHVLSDNRHVLYERTIFVKDKYGHYEYKRIYTLFDLLIFIFKCIKWVFNICVSIVIGICNIWYILIRNIFFYIRGKILVFFKIVKQFRLFRLIIELIQTIRNDLVYRLYYKLKRKIYVYIYKPYIYIYMRKVKRFLYKIVREIGKIVRKIGRGLFYIFIEYGIKHKTKFPEGMDPIKRKYMSKKVPYYKQLLRRAYNKVLYFLELFDFIFYGGLAYWKYKFEFFFGKDYEVYKNVVHILQYIFNIESLSDYFYLLYSLNFTSLRFLFIKSFLVAFIMFFFYFIIFKLFTPEDELECNTWEWWIFIGLFFIVQTLFLGSYMGYGVTIPPFTWYQL